MKKKKSNSGSGTVQGPGMAGGLNANVESAPHGVCRDFLRNVCHRGKRCKYLHERSDHAPVDEYTFCHDFQNGMCTWTDCKFLHCTESEEKHFRTTGQLPPHILSRIKNNNEKDFTMCKDFLKGSCHRVNCKFRHYKKDEQQSNMIPASQMNPPRPPHNFNGLSSGDNRRFEEDRR